MCLYAGIACLIAPMPLSWFGVRWCEWLAVTGLVLVLGPPLVFLAGAVYRHERQRRERR